MDNIINVEKADMQPEKGLVIQNITIRPVQRQTQDIKNWRNALVSAEATMPVLVPLYDLYYDIILDPVLSSLIEKRILGVTKTKLAFVDKAGKPVEDICKLTQRKAFRDLRCQIALAKIWGIRVVELMNDNEFSIYAIPQKHIRPKEGKIVREQYGNEGVYYRQPPNDKYILEVGRFDDWGLLLKAAPYVIYKRGGFGNWANFAQIFGMPFREARYDGYNAQTRYQLETALDSMGSAGYGIFPKEAELTFHEANNVAANGQLYDTLRQACNQELSVLILGQTETTTKTAGKLGGNDQTHEKTEDDINYNDKLDELSVLNEKVKPILANLGFNVDGEFIHATEEDEVPLTDMVTILKGLKNDLKLPLNDDYLYEKFKVPKPDNYAELKAKQEEAAAAAAPAPANVPPPPEPKPGKKDKNNNKLSAWDELRLKMAAFFDQAHPD